MIRTLVRTGLIAILALAALALPMAPAIAEADIGPSLCSNDTDHYTFCPQYSDDYITSDRAETLRSPSGRYRAYVNGLTCRLTVEDLIASNPVIWSSANTRGCYSNSAGRRPANFAVQSDGNAVVYEQRDGVPGQPLGSFAAWATGTRSCGTSKSRVTMQNDGNLVQYTTGANPHAVWSSKGGRIPGYGCTATT